MFMLHVVVFLVANVIMWYPIAVAPEWKYPWPAWITAAWGLMIIAHACTIWGNYDDQGMDTFHRQVKS